MRSLRLLYGTVALALLLTGCQQQIPGTVKIGLAQPLSGPLAALGTDMRNGAELAIEELNAQGYKVRGKAVKLELVVEDDRSDPEEGKRAAERLLQADVRAVIGHLNSNVSIEAAPIYSGRNIAQLAISTNPKFTQLGLPTTFRLVANDDQQAKAIVSYAVNQLDGRRVAAVDDGSIYGKSLTDLAVAEISRAGRKVELRKSYDNKNTNFTDFVRDAKVQRPDVIIVALLDFQVLALIDQLTKEGVTDVTLIGGNSLKTNKVVGKPHALKAIYATSPAIDATGFVGGKQFVARFRSKFGSEPIYGAHYAYDAVHAVAHAMRRGDTVVAKEIVAELKRKDLIGPATGGLNFAESGEQRYPSIAVYKPERGRWEQMMRSDRW
jgi:branched-chain amino acid transport system substrate-binding protein